MVLHDGAFSRRQGAVRALVDLRFGGVGEIVHPRGSVAVRQLVLLDLRLRAEHQSTDTCKQDSLIYRYLQTRLVNLQIPVNKTR